MADLALYGLRLLQYLSLMLLSGLPLLQWQAGFIAKRQATAPAWIDSDTLRRWLLASLAIAVLSNAIEVPLKTMRIMGLPLLELDAGSLHWYVIQTPAGLAWLMRSTLLFVLAVWLGWRRPLHGHLRNLGIAVLACAALMTLLWNGHAGASAGLASWLRLGIGAIHLLAAAAWSSSIVGFLILLAGQMIGCGNPDAGARLHALLHAFSGTGSVLVAALAITGIVHYFWIQNWALSPATLVATTYGRWMLFKLLLFASMLGLAALHRWVLVPRMASATESNIELRRSLQLEAAIAILVVAAVAVLGTMSPHA